MYMSNKVSIINSQLAPNPYTTVITIFSPCFDLFFFSLFFVIFKSVLQKHFRDNPNIFHHEIFQYAFIKKRIRTFYIITSLLNLKFNT